jgi:hypothetical protein
MIEHRSSVPSSPSAVSDLIDRLRNGDIRWDGTLDGFMPTIVGDSARQLLAIGDDAFPHLISALEDESRFIAAHVLLTMLSGVEYYTAPWNGLEIELSAEGEVRIDVRQRFELARLWRAWQQTIPHPRTLLSE